jgi:hypothetical protein
MTIVTAFGAVGIRSVCLVTLIAGDHIAFVTPMVLIVAISIMYPPGPGGRFAARLSKMALGTFFGHLVAVRTGIHWGRAVKLGAFLVQPCLSQGMGCPVTVAVVAILRSGVKPSLEIMTKSACLLVCFEFQVTVLAVLPICVLRNPAAIGTKMTQIASENTVFPIEIQAVARFTDFYASLLGYRPVKIVCSLKLGVDKCLRMNGFIRRQIPTLIRTVYQKATSRENANGADEFPHVGILTRFQN